MIVLPEPWKLVAAAGLAAMIFASVLAKAPARFSAASEPQKLVMGSLALYAVGAAAWMTGHLRIATILFGTGIGTAALGAWLSRAADGRERVPMADAGPSGEPHDPGGPQLFDWAAFERELLDYTSRQRQTAGLS
ncbi:MAG: hypothetical protein M3025_00975 [Actinomycetota bacterium]|nr:hypothetical protein [Actinomycetota bacterium]